VIDYGSGIYRQFAQIDLVELHSVQQAELVIQREAVEEGKLHRHSELHLTHSILGLLDQAEFVRSARPARSERQRHFHQQVAKVEQRLVHWTQPAVEEAQTLEGAAESYFEQMETLAELQVQY
jgi:hypothetical protein